MKRLLLTTLLALIVAFTLGTLLQGWPRVAALACIWTTYTVILTCGVTLIQMQFFAPAICRGRPGRKLVALTFDDGPDPVATPALLDLLARHRVPAAFFCIGKNVDAHPLLAARIAAEGHLLANHSYHHPWWMAFLRTPGLTRQMTMTQRAIEQSAGVTPIYMRPPVGLTNPHYPAALKQNSLTLVGWDVRSFDTTGDPRSVLDRITRKTRDGSIILLHDGRSSPERITQIIDPLIPALRARGFNFARLDELIEPPKN